MTTLFRLLDVEKTYTLRSRGTPVQLKALDGIRLELQAGVSLALVGESGSGKSTLVRLMLGLEAPSDGKVFYGQTDMTRMDARMRASFCRRVAFIYQDARGSLDPRMRVEDLLAEPIRLHALRPRREIPARVEELLDRVGLPQRLQHSYPGELSGGQVRRVAVARALASEPQVIFADESVAGLDVSVQAQLLNLLRSLCSEMGLTLVFVTHDLGVASFLCDTIAVMYLGRIVEHGSTWAILEDPKHPYTLGLLRSFPRFGQPLAAPLAGEIPSPVDLPPGCRFASRCPRVQPLCHTSDPALTERAPGRHVACHFPLDGVGAAQAA
jgi:oligopeptide/dipeptide ABC transporter ATP-binding protein